MDRLILIDGNAIIHRAYHAYPKTLTTSKGKLINAVYGFTSILLSAFKQLSPEYVAVAFDLKAPTFRHKKFKGYKASRPKMDEELVSQIDRVKEVVKTLNIPIFEKEGFEADDVIGTLARQAASRQPPAARRKPPAASRQPPVAREERLETGNWKLETIIVTGDRDALQLIDNNVKVYLPARGKRPAEMVDRKEFIKKYGFEPKRLVDLKALAGDASDEIPGVKGVGPKTATDLIVKFGDLKGIYKNLDEIKERVRKKLIEDKKQAVLSWELAEIVTDVPIKFKLSKCKLADYDREKVLKLFEKLEFRSLIGRLPDDGWDEMVKKEIRGDSDRKKSNPVCRQTGLKALRKTSSRGKLNLTESIEERSKQMELF